MKKISSFFLYIMLFIMAGACTKQADNSSVVPAGDFFIQPQFGPCSFYDSSFEINLTNKMLQSPVFADKKQMPCIVVADICQNTLEKNLRVQDIHDRIIEVLFYSEQVRVVDNSAENYDYMLQPELTDMIVKTPDGGQKWAGYILTVTLFDRSGSFKGQWFEELPMPKNR